MKRATDLPRLTTEQVLKAANLTRPEARFLVSDYYTFQDMRKRADMQIRHLSPDKEMPYLLQYTADSSAHIETQIKRALLKYAEGTRVGQWMLAQVGIAEVISAGLLAYLDVDQAPTVGHWWRFAGLDPTSQWKSADYVDGFVKSARRANDGDWAALINICAEMHRRPLAVLHSTKVDDVPLLERIPEPDEIRQYLSEHGSSAVIKAEFHADNMLREALQDNTVLANAYSTICPDVKFDWTAIKKMLSKRPWNAGLKQICWHAGQSFKKVSGDRVDAKTGEPLPPAFYGKLYREQKDKVVRKNEQGAYAERARTFVTKSADVRKTLSEGRLPAGNLDSQACRYAVKIFLSHLHAVMYWDTFNAPPPRPFAIQHLGHAHEIKIPNLDMFPGLEAAYYGARQQAA